MLNPWSCTLAYGAQVRILSVLEVLQQGFGVRTARDDTMRRARSGWEEGREGEVCAKEGVGRGL